MKHTICFLILVHWKTEYFARVGKQNAHCLIPFLHVVVEFQWRNHLQFVVVQLHLLVEMQVSNFCV